MIYANNLSNYYNHLNKIKKEYGHNSRMIQSMNQKT
jgi:hypothetical protein